MTYLHCKSKIGIVHLQCNPIRRMALASETIPRHMPAWICRDYGGPELLARQERPVPLPGPDDVLIRVRAASVS